MVSFRRLKSGLQKEVVREVKTIRWIPLESVVPGHPLWERVVGYAARDAVLGLGVYDVAMEQIRRTRRYMPW
jgi:hypothetical protein